MHRGNENDVNGDGHLQNVATIRLFLMICTMCILNLALQIRLYACRRNFRFLKSNALYVLGTRCTFDRSNPQVVLITRRKQTLFDNHIHVRVFGSYTRLPPSACRFSSRKHPLTFVYTAKPKCVRTMRFFDDRNGERPF